MAGAFGSAQGAPKWSDRQFLENHPMLRVGGLRGTEVTVTVNGHTQIVQLEMQWTFGHKERQRPWFGCSCGARCRILHEKDGAFVCWLCSGYDYRSRHRNRSTPALNKLRRLRRFNPGVRPTARLAREAQSELERLLSVTVRDLDRRAKRRK